MAIRISAVKYNACRIVSREDDSLDFDNEEMDFDLYVKDCIKNEGALRFKEGQKPTIFLCNFDFSGKEATAIKNYMAGSGDEFGSKQDTKVTMGSWAYKVVQMGLREIENPAGTKDGLELKKDGKGGGKYVSEATMTQLIQMGIVDELFVHYLALTKADKVREAAKN